MLPTTRTKTKYTPEVADMLRVMLEQKHGTDLVVVPKTDTALAVRQTMALERRAHGTVAEAKDIGVNVEYLGVAPMFKEPRLYEAEPHDWIFGPGRPQDLKMPKQELAILRKLANADIDFPVLYVAHEVEKVKTNAIEKATDTVHTTIEEETATALIGPTPGPPKTLTLGDKLEQRTTTIVNTAKKTAKAGGIAAAGIAAAPLVVGAAAVAALAEMDPIVIGAMPMGEPREGTPAAWFVLCRWAW